MVIKFVQTNGGRWLLREHVVFDQRLGQTLDVGLLEITRVQTFKSADRSRS